MAYKVIIQVKDLDFIRTGSIEVADIETIDIEKISEVPVHEFGTYAFDFNEPLFAYNPIEECSKYHRLIDGEEYQCLESDCCFKEGEHYEVIKLSSGLALIEKKSGSSIHVMNIPKSQFKRIK